MPAYWGVPGAPASPPSAADPLLIVIGSPFSTRRLVDEPARLASMSRWQRLRDRLGI